MSDTISLYEEYVFSDDKTEFLKDCKNGSDVRKIIRINHLLNNPGTPLEKEDVETLEQWKTNRAGGDKKNLVIKHEITEILNEGDAEKRKELMKNFNNKYFNYSFNDARQTAGAQGHTQDETGHKQELKTALTKEDHDEMSLDKKLKEIYDAKEESINLSFSLRDLGKSELSKLDFAKIEPWKIKESLFGLLDNFVYSEVR